MFLGDKTAKKTQDTNDFKMRGPFAGYRPVDYKDYEPFVKLKPVLEQHLTKLCAGEIDEGVKNALDPIIYDAAGKAEEDLKLQKIKHIGDINNIYERRLGDKNAFESQLVELNAALEENEREIEEIESRYQVNKF